MVFGADSVYDGYVSQATIKRYFAADDFHTKSTVSQELIQRPTMDSFDRNVLRRTVIDINARKKTPFKMGRVNQLLYEGFASIIPAIWKKCVEHVMCVEEKYWARDALVDDLRTPSSLR